jgi:hypothetical protein
MVAVGVVVNVRVADGLDVKEGSKEGGRVGRWVRVAVGIDGSDVLVSASRKEGVAEAVVGEVSSTVGSRVSKVSLGNGVGSSVSVTSRVTDGSTVWVASNVGETIGGGVSCSPTGKTFKEAVWAAWGVSSCSSGLSSGVLKVRIMPNNKAKAKIPTTMTATKTSF